MAEIIWNDDRKVDRKKVEGNIQESVPLRCIERVEGDKKNVEGDYYGYIKIGEVAWAIVLEKGNTDPGFYKVKGILVEQKQWALIEV